MSADESQTTEEAELKGSIEAILQSKAQKKLLIAGPGTGKTYIFKRLLRLATGSPEQHLVLTFINYLKNDLEKNLGGLANVHTLHSYCLGLLFKNPKLREGLSPEFRCCPGLANLIEKDWTLIEGREPPRFVSEMRGLLDENHIDFYIKRGNYYDAVDFDDSVYRAYYGLMSGRDQINHYELILIDEYQDFNRLEAGLINILGNSNPIVIAGDDDQALYSQLRDASWDYIRSLCNAEDYRVFELPFCMRCPKVVVDAVGDVIVKAREINKLEGRIDKPYKHYPPKKGADSVKYPKIDNIITTVQRKDCNYIGQYIAQEIVKIPGDEIEEAISEGFPIALVIAANPYRDQIIEKLKINKINVETRVDTTSDIKRDVGLQTLRMNPLSNLGWRIMLDSDNPDFLRDVILATRDVNTKLIDVIPDGYREAILSEAILYNPPDPNVDNSGTESEYLTPYPMVRVTSFEGSKGMSAQRVFIAGIHDGELPHDPVKIRDLEICKFVVGLTRTRKKCTLIHTRRFGKEYKNPSIFISWIKRERLNSVVVDKLFWIDHK